MAAWSQVSFLASPLRANIKAGESSVSARLDVSSADSYPTKVEIGGLPVECSFAGSDFTFSSRHLVGSATQLSSTPMECSLLDSFSDKNFQWGASNPSLASLESKGASLSAVVDVNFSFADAPALDLSPSSALALAELRALRLSQCHREAAPLPCHIVGACTSSDTIVSRTTLGDSLSSAPSLHASSDGSRSWLNLLGATGGKPGDVPKTLRTLLLSQASTCDASSTWTSGQHGDESSVDPPGRPEHKTAARKESRCWLCTRSAQPL